MAALKGKLDCLDHLIAKGANLEAADNVSVPPRQPAPSPTCALAFRPRRTPLLLPRPRRRRCDRMWRRRRASV
eukprot:scaffold77761_cov45-Phaeocystis_antarctica.AAC.1